MPYQIQIKGYILHFQQCISNGLEKDLIINKKADDIYLVDDMQTDDFTMDVDRMLK